MRRSAAPACAHSDSPRAETARLASANLLLGRVPANNNTPTGSSHRRLRSHTAPGHNAARRGSSSSCGASPATQSDVVRRPSTNQRRRRRRRGRCRRAGRFTPHSRAQSTFKDAALLVLPLRISARRHGTTGPGRAARRRRRPRAARQTATTPARQQRAHALPVRLERPAEPIGQRMGANLLKGAARWGHLRTLTTKRASVCPRHRRCCSRRRRAAAAAAAIAGAASRTIPLAVV